MPAHRDFDVLERHPEAKGPTFTLAGETFTCLPVLPAGAWMDVPDADFWGQVVIAGAFILGCLLPAEEERFRALLRSKTPVIGIGDLHPILTWLLGPAWKEDADPGASPPTDEG